MPAYVALLRGVNLVGKLADAGARAVFPVALLDPVVMRRAGGDLRRVGNDQHLALLGEAREPFSNGARDCAADSAVYFVEDHRRRAPGLGKRDFEGKDEAR